MTETIFALSSGHVPSAVAIVRLSGPAVGAVVTALTGQVPPPPRRVVLRRLCDSAGDLIDTAVVLFWRGPASFTGEDVAEFHVHGGRAVVAKLLATLGAQAGCRPAEAGAFTRQAFLNGRLDLTAVEGLGDLIGAETDSQRRSALAQLDGGLRHICDNLVERLIQARAELEAAIDFADESDVPAEIVATALSALAAIDTELARLLAAGRPAERARDGLTVVLAGAPNAGKSSLLNALAGRDVAIVSAEAGTTRDVLSVDLDLAGFPVRLYDTAGLRAAGGAVEQEGVRRALQRAVAADLVLLLQAVDDRNPAPILETTAPVWRLRSKVDLAPGVDVGALVAEMGIAVSTVTPSGLDRLIAGLTAFAATTLAGEPGDILLQERQRWLLVACGEHLDKALAPGQPIELVAEETRLATDALAAITGAVSTEAVLGAIFARFCIGK